MRDTVTDVSAGLVDEHLPASVRAAITECRVHPFVNARCPVRANFEDLSRAADRPAAENKVGETSRGASRRWQ
jgi:hypothetical protein